MCCETGFVPSLLQCQFAFLILIVREMLDKASVERPGMWIHPYKRTVLFYRGFGSCSPLCPISLFGAALARFQGVAQNFILAVADRQIGRSDWDRKRMRLFFADAPSP